MDPDRRRHRWRTSRSAVVVCSLLVVAACSGGSDGVAVSGDATPPSTGVDAPAGDGSDVTINAEPRPVPTVTSPAAGGSVVDGVVDGVPTIAPPPPPVIDPDVPLSTIAPPTTELVGDVQPDPDASLPPPPPPSPNEPTMCSALADFGVPGAIAGAAGVDEPDPVGRGSEICVYARDGVTVEVHRVDESVVVDDWYQRSGVEPVGEVGGAAVGLTVFAPPGGDEAPGYTIALTGGRRGVIVAARTARDARLVAAEVAVLAAQAV